MKTKKELLLIIIGAALSVALIVSMIIIIVSSNNHKGQNHEIAWEVSVTPTYETEGLATGKCTKCKKEFKEKLPKLGGSDYEVAEYLGNNRSCEVEKECVLKIVLLDNDLKFNATLRAERHMLDNEEIVLDENKVYVIKEDDPDSSIKCYANVELECKEEGVLGYFICEKCKTAVNVKVRKEHAPEDGTAEDVNATFTNCTDSGITDPFVCRFCNKVVRVNVPSKGHDYECDVKPNGTSPETYTVTLKCKRCGADDSKQNVVSVTEDRIEPECGKIGKINYTLGLPGGGEFKFTVYLPALEHESIVYGVMNKEKYSILAYPALIPENLDETEIKCNSAKEFWASYTCIHCGKKESVQIYRPHKAPENTKWIDDTSKGIKYRTFKCEECGEQVREEIPAEADHDYVYTVKKLSSGYEVTGTCIYCSNVKTIRVDKVEEIIAKEPTCQKEGQKVYHFTADGQNYTASEAIAKKAHKFKGEDIIVSGKHYLCNQDGIVIPDNEQDRGLLQCDDCHKMIVIYVSHTEPDASEIVIIEPTTETEGKRIYKCKACGKTIEETIPKKDEE